MDQPISRTAIRSQHTFGVTTARGWLRSKTRHEEMSANRQGNSELTCFIPLGKFIVIHNIAEALFILVDRVQCDSQGAATVGAVQELRMPDI